MQPVRQAAAARLAGPTGPARAHQGPDGTAWAAAWRHKGASQEGVDTTTTAIPASKKDETGTFVPLPAFPRAGTGVCLPVQAFRSARA
eukprot:1591861-Alexandrium_andersonii.AAC.1